LIEEPESSLSRCRPEEEDALLITIWRRFAAAWITLNRRGIA
jgi:hypothetical protein